MKRKLDAITDNAIDQRVLHKWQRQEMVDCMKMLIDFTSCMQGYYGQYQHNSNLFWFFNVTFKQALGPFFVGESVDTLAINIETGVLEAEGCILCIGPLGSLFNLSPSAVLNDPCNDIDYLSRKRVVDALLRVRNKSF